MVLPLAPIIGAGIGLLGGVLQNASNAATADKQMAFQKEMSDTSYQRGVKDMKAAGLNPMLAYSQGGASSAAGASYQAANVGEAATRGAESMGNSANSARLIGEQVKNIAADTDLKKANEKAAGAATVVSLANAQLANANSARVAQLLPWEITDLAGRANVSANAAIASNLEKDYVLSVPGRTARMLALGGKDAASATSAASNVRLFGR